MDGKTLLSLITVAQELDRRGDLRGLRMFFTDINRVMPLVHRLDYLEDQLRSFGSPGIPVGPNLRATWVSWLDRLLLIDRLCRAPGWRLNRPPHGLHGGVRRTYPSRHACLPTPN